MSDCTEVRNLAIARVRDAFIAVGRNQNGLDILAIESVAALVAAAMTNDGMTETQALQHIADGGFDVGKLI